MTRSPRLAAVALALASFAPLGCGRASEPEPIGAPIDRDPPRGDTLDVFVAADGVTWCAGEPILDDATIQRRAEAFHQRRPHGAARVRCERAALHGRLVRVRDLLQEAGIARSSVEVMP